MSQALPDQPRWVDGKKLIVTVRHGLMIWMFFQIFHLLIGGNRWS